LKIFLSQLLSVKLGEKFFFKSFIFLCFPATEVSSTTEESILEPSETLSVVDLMQQDAIYQDEVFF